jgi:hypothetical protein
MDAVVIGAEDPHPAKTLFRAILVSFMAPSYPLGMGEANRTEWGKKAAFADHL